MRPTRLLALLPALAAAAAPAFQAPPPPPLFPSRRGAVTYRHRRAAAAPDLGDPKSRSPPPPLFAAPGAGEKERLLSELNDLTASFESVQSTIERNAKLYRERLKSYESKVEGLEKELEASRAGVEERDGRIAELERARDELRGELDWAVRKGETEADEEGGGRKIEKDRTIAKLTAEIEALKEARDRYASVAEEREEDLKRERELLEDVRKELQQERSAWKKQLQNAADSAKESIAEKDAVISGLRSERDDLANARSRSAMELELIERDLRKSEDSLAEAWKALEEERSRRAKEGREAADAANWSVLELKKKENALREGEELLGKVRREYEESRAAWKQKEGELLQERDGLLRTVEAQSVSLAELEARAEEFNKVRMLLQGVEGERAEERARWDRKMAELVEERDGLIRTVGSLREELQQTMSRAQTEVTKELMGAKASSIRERDALLSRLETSLERRGAKIKEMEEQLEQFEKERTSLRKLIVLGLKRIGSFFRIRRRRKTKNA